MPTNIKAKLARPRARKAKAAQGERADAIYKLLKKAHPDAHIELDFRSPLELLIATILSAQCTDAKVNQVTARLFKDFRTVRDFAQKPLSRLEELIRPTGFFRQKAKSIQGAARAILERHNGKVPQSMEELTKLPGVGRKTANVVLGNAFSIPGLPVDTHVTRVSHRLALTGHTDPVKIEAELCALLPPKRWTLFSHLLIFHGRRICKARKPLCDACPLQEHCEYFRKVVHG